MVSEAEAQVRADSVSEKERGTDVNPSEGGFTLVEIIVAVMILAVGLLGLAGTTGYVVRQTNLAELTTERSMALQTVVESLRARTYSAVATDGGGNREIGEFQTSWSVVVNDGTAMTLEVVTVGPGLASGTGPPSLADQVADTFSFQRLNFN